MLSTTASNMKKLKRIVDFILGLFIYDVKFHIIDTVDGPRMAIRFYTHTDPESEKFRYTDFLVGSLKDRNLYRLCCMAGPDMLALLPKVPEHKLQGFLEYIAANLRAKFRTGPNGTRAVVFLFAKNKTEAEAHRPIGLIKGRQYINMYFTELYTEMTSKQLAHLKRKGRSYLTTAFAGSQKHGYLFTWDGQQVCFEGVPVNVTIVDPVVAGEAETADLPF